MKNLKNATNKEFVMKKKPFLDVAERLFNEKFTMSKVMFVAGSLARGEGTEKSDIDCCIVFDLKDCPRAYRETIYFQDYICELFLQNENSIEYFAAEEADIGIPIIQNMVAEGIVFGDVIYAQVLKKRIQMGLDKGPKPLTSDQIEKSRYTITDLMDDIPAKYEYELLGTLSVLLQTLGNFYLRANGQWSGHRKSLQRELKKYNSRFADKYGTAFKSAFEQNNFSLLEKLVDEVLAPFGGRLMEGYKQFVPDRANEPFASSNDTMMVIEEPIFQFNELTSI
jgi:predicted nucleotidyltransferase